MKSVIKGLAVVVLIVILCLPVRLQAQKSYIDSLKTVISVYERVGKHYQELVTTYCLLANEMTFVNPAEAETILRKAMDKARESGDNRLIYWVYYDYGRYYRAKGSYSLSLDNLYKAYVYILDYDERASVGWALIDIGNVYYAMDNMSTAARFYHRALANFNVDQKDHGASVALNNIGLVKLRLHDYDSALICFTKVLENRKSRNDYPIPVALNYLYVGKVYLNKARYEEALNYFNLAITTLRTADSNQVEVAGIHSDIYKDIGQLFFNTKEYWKAEAALNLAIANCRRIGDSKGMASIYRYIAENYLQLKRTDLASTYADSLYKLSDVIKDIDLKASACQIKSTISLEYGNTELGQKYFQEYLGLQKKLIESLKSNFSEEMEVATETLAQEKEFDLKKKNFWLYIYALMAIIIALVFMAIIILKIYFSKKRQELHFRQLSNSTFEGIFIHDTKKISLYNDKILNLLGISKDEILDLKPLDIIHPDYLEMIKGNAPPIAQQENRYEIEIVRKDGSRLPVELLTRNFDESKGLIIVAVREITSEKKTRFALKESERKMETLLGSLPGMAYRCKNDKSWTMEFVSKGCFKLTGYKPEELLYNNTLSYNDLIVPETRDFLWRKWQQVIEAKSIFEYEYQIITANGERKWVWESGRGIFDDEDKLQALEGFIMDVTEQKIALSDIIKSEMILKESNATKDKFFSIIAHDLKGPLHALLGFSDLLKYSYSEYSDEDRVRYISNIHEVADQLNRLLQNLLEWSRSKTGRLTYNPEIRHLSLIVKSANETLAEQAKSKNISIISKVSVDTKVFCDENMIQTVVRNLISNAIKFNFPGGKIMIDADDSSPDEVVISVSDNGIGIPKFQVSKLFKIDEVYKSDGTLKEKGSGLGLILCREFVEKHGGHIWADSDAGKGSSFYFTLPKNS